MSRRVPTRSYVIALESHIRLLQDKNKQLKSFVVSLGDRLVKNAEKFSVLAEKKITKVERRIVAGDKHEVDLDR